MRLSLPLLAALLTVPLAGGLQAQTVPLTPPAAAPPIASPPVTTPSVVTPGTTHARRRTGGRRRMTPAQRFAAANTTHDGHLTRDQAKAGHMFAVYRHFDAIDTGRKGYVTRQDMRSYAKAHHRARHAAKPGTRPAAATD